MKSKVETINVSSYIEQEQNDKRILLVKKPSRIKSYVKSLKARLKHGDDKVVRNLEYKTVSALAKDVYFYRSAMEDSYDKTAISDMEALVILKKILKENVPNCTYFASESLITLGVVKEFFGAIKAVRSNGWSAAADKLASVNNRANRINDIKLVIDKYEEYLKKNNLADTVILLEDALEWIKTKGADSKLLQEVFGHQVKISVLCDDFEESLTLEKDFAMACLEGTKGQMVAIFHDSNSIDIDSPKVKFFKGHGLKNESNYVVADILKNKYPLGKVKVVYASGSQQQYIEAAFRSNDIPVRMVTPVSMSSNSVIDLCRKILAWAKDDYSEKALEKVMGNSSIYVEGFFYKEKEKITKDEETSDDNKSNSNVSAIEINGIMTDDESDRTEADEELDEIEEDLSKTEKRKKLKEQGFLYYNYIGGTRYLEHVMNAKSRSEGRYDLAWGYDRNIAFLDNEEIILKANYDAKMQELGPDSEETVEGIREIERYTSRKRVIELHRALLNIFPKDKETKLKPIAVYDLMLGFIKEFTKIRSLDYREARGALNLARPYIAREEAMKLNDVIDYLDEALQDLKCGEKEAYDCPVIEKFSSWVNLDRDNVYFIGMSLKDFLGNSDESPVMRDRDWDELVQGDYKPTAKSRIEQRNRDFYRSLSTFMGDTISFGYSNYDIASHSEMGPSTAFRDLMERYSDKSIDSLQEFVYGKSTDSKKEALKDHSEYHKEFAINLKTSNTGIEELIECPKKYAYNKRLRVDMNEVVDKADKQGEWLNPAQRGLFFHSVAEKYVEANLLLPTGKPIPEEVNTSSIDEIIFGKDGESGLKGEYLKTIPYRSLGDVEKEIDLISEAAKAYFNKLHIDLSKGKDVGWRVLNGEIEFKGLIYNVKSYNKKTYKFELDGIIDRVDYRCSEAEKAIHIRIVDYKTGKQSTKDASKSMGGLTQHTIYRKAFDDAKIKNQIKKAIKAREGSTVKDYAIKFDNFTYVFPMDEQKEIKILEKDLEKDIEDLGIVRLKTILTVLEDMKSNATNIYPDKLDVFYKIKEYVSSNAEVAEFAKSIAKDDELTSTKGNYTKGCKYCGYAKLCLKRRAGEINVD